MGKYCGKIGYAESLEESPGVWVEKIVDRTYFGDIFKNAAQINSHNTINYNVSINNIISIIADAYAYEHIYNMRYVTWMKQKWSIREVNVQRPRLILTLGGIYNEEATGSSYDSSLYFGGS